MAEYINSAAAVLVCSTGHGPSSQSSSAASSRQEGPVASLAQAWLLVVDNTFQDNNPLQPSPSSCRKDRRHETCSGKSVLSHYE